MTTTPGDPIDSEIRAARQKHAAQFGYDIKEIFISLRAQQETSGRKYVKYPARRLGSATSDGSNQ